MRGEGKFNEKISEIISELKIDDKEFSEDREESDKNLKNPESGLASTPKKGSLRSQLLKLISLSVAWGYLGYALELADYGRQKNIFSQQEFDEMASPWLTTQDVSDYLPSFYGRHTLARLFDFLSYLSLIHI